MGAGVKGKMSGCDCEESRLVGATWQSRELFKLIMEIASPCRLRHQRSRNDNLMKLLSECLQPGGGLDFFFQQVLEVGADDALQFTGKFAFYLNACDIGKVSAL